MSLTGSERLGISGISCLNKSIREAGLAWSIILPLGGNDFSSNLKSPISREVRG